MQTLGIKNQDRLSIRLDYKTKKLVLFDLKAELLPITKEKNR